MERGTFIGGGCGGGYTGSSGKLLIGGASGKGGDDGDGSGGGMEGAFSWDNNFRPGMHRRGGDQPEGR